MADLFDIFVNVVTWAIAFYLGVWFQKRRAKEAVEEKAWLHDWDKKIGTVTRVEVNDLGHVEIEGKFEASAEFDDMFHTVQPRLQRDMCRHFANGHQIPCPPQCPTQDWPESRFDRSLVTGNWKLKKE